MTFVDDMFTVLSSVFDVSFLFLFLLIWVTCALILLTEQQEWHPDGKKSCSDNNVILSYCGKIGQMNKN